MTATLTYVNGRGLGERIRFVLYAAGIEFNEVFIQSKSEFESLKNSGKLIFGQLPILEIDGKVITQTDAMIRYIARHHNLNGRNDDDVVRLDMVYDGIKDCAISRIAVGLEFGTEEEKVQSKNGMKTQVAKYFPKFEKILKDNLEGTGNYLVGSQLTFVDVIMAHEFDWFYDVLGEDLLNDYPTLKKYRDSLVLQPNIAKFLSSPQKKPYPSSDYVTMAKSIFR